LGIEVHFPPVPAYTGQYLADYVNLYWYNSRFYDHSLARFTQPDTIIPSPGNTLAWDRFSYVQNNPLKYTDPTGHDICNDPYDEGCDGWTDHINDWIKSGALPKSAVIPDKLPTRISDPTLMHAWILLYNTESGHDGAVFIQENNIPVVWGEGRSNLPLNCLVDENRCTVPEGAEIQIDQSLKDGPIEAVAGYMAHEAYQYTQPFGDVRNSLYEEFRAFDLTYTVMNETATLLGNAANYVNLTNGFDPYDYASLRAFFRQNVKFNKYLNALDVDRTITAYPPQYLNFLFRNNHPPELR
jgi:RHS repeat-associated protein